MHKKIFPLFVYLIILLILFSCKMDTEPLQVEAPVISPESGNYSTSVTVSLTCTTSQAHLYYTVDGSTPSENNGILYSTPFIIDDDVVIHVIASRNGWTSSVIVSSEFIISKQVETPQILPTGGSFTSGQTVSISCGTPGASIVYTTDGTDPGESNGSLYTGNFTVSSSCTVKAMAYLSGWESSAVCSEDFTINGTIASPVFTPEGGTYTTGQSVEISCATEGSSIYYTLDDSRPSSENGLLYQSAISISDDTTLKAIALKDNWTDSSVVSASYVITGTVTEPVITPAGGSFSSEQTVSISSGTPGASIVYTTDGSDPGELNGSLYTGSFTVSSSCTVKAMAYLSGWESSAVCSENFTINGTIAAPIFTPAGGTYTTGQSVEISCATEGSSIYYTLDDSIPSSENGLLYQSAISVSDDTTLKAIALKDNWTDSSVVSASYVITGTITEPVITPAGGSFSSEQIVSISCGTPGASIVYTTDGTDPGESNGSLYTGSFTVSSSCTVKAMAYLSGWESSAVCSVNFEITGTVSDPVVSLDSGTYSSRQTVTLSCDTEGAEIRYTLDGAEPTSLTGTVYTEEITIDKPETLKAIAYKTDWADSSVVSRDYKITFFSIGLLSYKLHTSEPIVLEVTSCDTAASGNIAVPAEISGIPVKYVGDECFSDCCDILSIVLPETITFIDARAFEYCESLKSINLPSSLTSFNNQLFEGCYSLEAISIPEGITSLGYRTFYCCYALSSVELPSTLESVSREAFMYAEGLSEIDLPDGVKTIGSEAFNSSGITSIIMPNSVTSVDGSAFANCDKLVTVVLSSGLDSLPYRAFYKCSAMENLTIPEGFEYIGPSVFLGCTSLRSVTLPESVTNISGSSFGGCSGLEVINIPAGITEIETSTFSGCEALVSITLPDSIETLGPYAFRNCSSLVEILSNSSFAKLSSLGKYTFDGCEKLTGFNIQGGLTEVPEGIFQDCAALSTVEIADNVTAISKNAFYGCADLTTVDLSSPNLKSIEENAFRDCEVLNNITLSSSLELLGDRAFTGCASLEIDTLPQSVISIGYGAFSGCDSIVDFSFPSLITVIPSLCFISCDALESVVLPANTNRINSEAFWGCSALSTINFPETLTYIGSGAFTYTGLGVIDLPEGLETIGRAAFAYSSVDSIDGNIDGVVHFPSGLINLGEKAFMYNTMEFLSSTLTYADYILPDGLLTIGEEAFMCSGLKSANLPAGITEIGDNTFKECRHLDDLYFYSLTAPSLGSGVFDSVSDCTFHIYPGATGYSGGEWDAFTLVEDL